MSTKTSDTKLTALPGSSSECIHPHHTSTRYSRDCHSLSFPESDNSGSKMKERHNSNSGKDANEYSKPLIASKSLAVLEAAEEIRRLKRIDKDGALSDSEIYDDILNLKSALGDDSDDIYDDIVTLLKAPSTPSAKPKLPSKPTWLLDAVKRRKGTYTHRLTSYEDIYDDIVVQKLQESSESESAPLPTATTKPRLPRRPTRLYRHPKVQQLVQQLKEKRNREVDLEEIYDDILTGFARDSHPQNDTTTAHDDEARLHQSQTEGHLTIPSEVTYLNLQALSPALDRRRKETQTTHLEGTSKLAQELQTETHQTCAPNQLSNGDHSDRDQQGLYENEDVFRGKVVQYKDGEQEAARFTKWQSEKRPRKQRSISEKESDAVNPRVTKLATLPACRPKTSHNAASSGRNMYDPLPDIDESRPLSLNLELFPHLKTTDSDESETYEDLPLYEDLQEYQEDPYQDAIKVVVKALDLPENMRQRANRLTRGERRRLRKNVRRKLGKLKRSYSMPEKSLLSSSLSATESTDPASESSGEEEEGPIPFGKSRVVFDMLLDASGIERVPSVSVLDPSKLKERPQSLETQSKSTQREDASESVGNDACGDDHEGYFNSLELKCIYENPEVRRYQEAGILQVRTKSEIAAEIEKLTASAPLEPPPLPGFQRHRARLITRTDKLLHKRFLMKRQQSLHSLRVPRMALKQSRASMPTISVPNEAATMLHAQYQKAVQEPTQTTKESQAEPPHIYVNTDAILTTTSKEESNPGTSYKELNDQREDYDTQRERSDTSSSIYDDVIPSPQASAGNCDKTVDPHESQRDRSSSDSSVYDDIIPSQPVNETQRDGSSTDSSIYDDVIPSQPVNDVSRRNGYNEC